MSFLLLFFYYHDSFEGILHLLSAAIGYVLVPFPHLHVPGVVVCGHSASPGFHIYAEDSMALKDKIKRLGSAEWSAYLHHRPETAQEKQNISNTTAQCYKPRSCKVMKNPSIRFSLFSMLEKDPDPVSGSRLKDLVH